MVVYKAKFLYDGWVSGSPNGAIYDSTDSDWFDGRTFNCWFKELFLPNLNGDGSFCNYWSTFGTPCPWVHEKKLEESSEVVQKLHFSSNIIRCF